MFNHLPSAEVMTLSNCVITSLISEFKPMWLFYRNRFGQIAWFVDIGTFNQCYVIAQ